MLIVEDERIVARDLQETLVGLGYDAFAIAASSDEAMARATERRPDLVLMDIRIKGGRDGIETATALRKRFDVPIVYLTAHADEATIERARATEPYGYVIKPVNSAELRSAVEVSIYKHGVDRQVRARERWFSTTLRSIADAVVAADSTGRVSFMNAAAEELTGVPQGDALGRPAREVVQLTDPVHPASPIDRALEQRASVTIDRAQLRHVLGTNRLISDSAAPVLDDGQVLGAVMVFRDVTEQEAVKRQLEAADRLAALGTMAAGVAHEVNNPLTVVVANGRFIESELRDVVTELRAGTAVGEPTIRRLEELLEAQQEALSGATRIGRIVSELKALARPSTQSNARADVARAVAWAVRATAHEVRHRAEVSTDVQLVAPVALDETRLGQVLVNLMINAAHAIAPGRVDGNRITVRAVQDREVVVIEVSDSGCGMEQEILGKVFEPFFTTKALGTGTGLGLSITQAIVSSVGGRIEAESQPGRGSVFRLFLPVAVVAQSTPAPAPDPAARRARLLVIDDEELVLRALTRTLKEHDLLCVQSAREALALLARGERFELILSDVMMPDMTGVEFFGELVRAHPDAAARVVFLTGGAISPAVAERLSGLDVLTIEKPFSPEKLREVIRSRLH
ncbi:MAG: response regulator [Archangium sp.]|nr:response regulator [Archangium sp.]